MSEPVLVQTAADAMAALVRWWDAEQERRHREVIDALGVIANRLDRLAVLMLPAAPPEGVSPPLSPGADTTPVGVTVESTSAPVVPAAQPTGTDQSAPTSAGAAEGELVTDADLVKLRRGLDPEWANENDLCEVLGVSRLEDLERSRLQFALRSIVLANSVKNTAAEKGVTQGRIVAKYPPAVCILQLTDEQKQQVSDKLKAMPDPKAREKQQRVRSSSEE